MKILGNPKRIIIIIIIIIIVFVVIGMVFSTLNKKEIVIYNTPDELISSDSIQAAIKSPKFNNFKSTTHTNVDIAPENYFDCPGTIKSGTCTFNDFDKAATSCLNMPNCRAILAKQDVSGEILYTVSKLISMQIGTWPLLVFNKI